MLKESWIMLRLLCLVINLFFVANLFAQTCPLKDGDLVFIKSQTNQSKLLQYTTGSEWTHVGMAFKRKGNWDIIEAVQPVRWTSLYSFMRRSRELSFEVRRATFPFDAEKVKSFAESKLGLDYDLVFAWDSKRWYCTELVWKAYKKASKEELGSLQSVGELQNIDHLMVKNEAKKRFEAYGLPYDHEVWKESKIITPVQMLNASNLEDVGNQHSVEDFSHCLKADKKAR